MGFFRLLENLPAAAYLCDRDGLITHFNDHAVRLWGRAPNLNDPVDRFCGSFKLFAVDGRPIPHDECWMALALKNGVEYNGEEVLIERPDGTRRTVLAHATPIRDESGQLVGAMNVLVDITDRKHAADAQSLLAAIVESSDDAIVSKTLDGHILTWNAGAQRLFGYTADEIIGRPITVLIPPDRQGEETTILSRLRRGQRIEHFETVRMTKDARLIDISVTISPVRDHNGQIVGASKVARDISARKRADQDLMALKDALAVQLADLRRLHEMSVRLSTTLDLHSILEDTLRTAVAINGTDLGLLSLSDENDCLQIVAAQGFDEEFLQSVHAIPPSVGAAGVAFQERRSVVVEDVSTDPYYADYQEMTHRAGFRAVQHTPLITRTGKAVGVLSTHFRQPHHPTDREMRLIDLCTRQAVDFIENARLYAQVCEADCRKDEFLATLAHELRNPRAPISNALHILRLSGELPPAAERVRDIMERQVTHMVRLVDDLLEVSRITRGKIELRREPLDLAAVIESAVDTSRPLITVANHQLAISMPPDVLTVDGDSMRLAQVIANLLNNAAKYTPEGGQIWLTTRREANEAVISVRDTGAGIPAEVLPRIFEMFAQGDRTLNRAQGGLGIGLTLAKSLVQLHGGRIEARSEGLGKGSEFIVHLPLSATMPKLIMPTPSRRTAEPLPPRQILVVDDAPAAAYILGKLLEKLGQQVRTAQSASTALECIRDDRPDVIISDIAMPNVNGYELAQRLRSHRELDGVVLVALTGYGQDSDRQRALDAGFDHHLVKPVSVEALEQLLSSLPRPPEEVVEKRFA
jgi:PAS domain S-box-containing protein